MAEMAQQMTAADADALNDLANDEREQKALLEGMYVVKNRGWARDNAERFLVYNQAGTEIYRVHTGAEACSCPDYEYRETYCKHQRRVDYVRGERELPPQVEGQIDGLLERQLP